MKIIAILIMILVSPACLWAQPHYRPKNETLEKYFTAVHHEGESVWTKDTVTARLVVMELDSGAAQSRLLVRFYYNGARQLISKTDSLRFARQDMEGELTSAGAARQQTSGGEVLIFPVFNFYAKTQDNHFDGTDRVRPFRLDTFLLYESLLNEVFTRYAGKRITLMHPYFVEVWIMD